MASFQKYIYVIAAFTNAYILIDFLLYDRLPTNFMIGVWGLYIVVSFFTQGVLLHYKQKTLSVFKEHYMPIIDDKNLTKEEKVIKINEVSRKISTDKEDK